MNEASPFGREDSAPAPLQAGAAAPCEQPGGDRPRRTTIMQALGLACLVAIISLGWFLLDGNIGINFADEGFLWYGTEAVKRGEVPMRDFQAYDPGRYLWCAAGSYVFGDDLVALRLSCVVFQMLGMFAALLVARRICPGWGFLTLVALTIAVWMRPRYKVFEQSIALIAIYAAVWLLEKPTLRRHAISGAFVGFMAIMGRNHGVYLLAAFGILVVWGFRGQSLTTWLRRSLAFGGGILLGYSPMLVGYALIPGFFDASMAQVREILTEGTNIDRPVPWPWTVPEEFGGIWWVGNFVQRCFYIALIAAAVLFLWNLFRSIKGRAAPAIVLASGAVALIYSHYTFSRPDSVHLAHSVPPMVMAALALALPQLDRSTSTRPAWVAIALLVASTLGMVLEFGFMQPILKEPHTYQDRIVAGRNMTVHVYHGRVLDVAEKLAGEIASPDDVILYLPHHPGLYVATGRRSPISQIYFMRPETIAEDELVMQEIEAKNVKWIMLQDTKLDERDELRFRNTNPLTFDYFVTHFGALQIPAPRDFVVLGRRSSQSPPGK